MAPRRPRALHTSQSFGRFESPPLTPSNRSRASTLQEGVPPDITHGVNIFSSTETEQGPQSSSDVFESREDDDGATETHVHEIAQEEALKNFEQLPIEMRSLTERFVESLSPKVQPAPLTVDHLSEAFQDFYIRVDSQISTHIATLAARLSRRASPSASRPSKNLKISSVKNGANIGPTDAVSTGADQQMLTASEITNRRKARRQLEVHRVALEEAVERAVCEKLYDRIWRHRSTDDEERDEKLRSRTAALAVIGIGLRELKVDGAEDILGQDAATKEQEIKHHLERTRSRLKRMNDEKYPEGKLHHLTVAHKNIVDTLSQFFPSTSSADEILPAFIYTLITTPSEAQLNMISNLNFIHRFRATRKIDGEAAWCLTNAEAAVSFLETVDLASLRAIGSNEDMNDKPRPGAELSELKTRLPMSSPVASPVTPGISAISTTSTDLRPPPSPVPLSSSPTNDPTTPGSPPHQRRLSNLLSARNPRMESASDALLRNADQALDTINTTLENSFNFLFGRLREQQAGNELKSPVGVPRTLEEARMLVSTRPPDQDEDDVSPGGSVMDAPIMQLESKPDSKLLEIIGGRRATRERSVDSTGSTSSGKKAALTGSKESSGERPKGHSPSASSNASPPVPAGPVESMRTLGSSLNPLNRLANMNRSWGFGRSPDPPSSSLPPTPREMSDEAARATLIKLSKSGPPIGRFVEMRDPRQMTLGDAEELLKDYQRLAAALEEAGLL